MSGQARKLRWGLLSTANINRALIGPLRAAQRSELTGVASRSRERAQAYAAQWEIPRAYGSYEEMLADPQIDVVYISLPNALHAAWTVKAAEAGKHVLCEKPLVVSREQMDQVEAAAQANGVTIFEAFMYLHHPQTQTARRLVQEGALGRLQTIQSWFHFHLPPEDAGNVRLSAPLEGGSLWDVGVYPNSLAITMAQPQRPQVAFASQILGESGVDVAMRGQIHFSGEVAAQISSGFRTPFREGAYLVGDEGVLWIPEPWKPGLRGDTTMTLTRLDGNVEERVIPAVNPYLCEVEAMEACVLDGAPPVVPLALSRTFLESVLALYASARTGQAQPVALGA